MSLANFDVLLVKYQTRSHTYTTFGCRGPYFAAVKSDRKREIKGAEIAREMNEICKFDIKNTWHTTLVQLFYSRRHIHTNTHTLRVQVYTLENYAHENFQKQSIYILHFIVFDEHNSNSDDNDDDDHKTECHLV